MGLCPKLKVAGEEALARTMRYRKRSKMQDEIQKKNAVNRREAKGVLKTVIMLKPAADQDMLTYCIHVLNFADRCSIFDNHPECMACLNRVWDETMEQQYMSVRAGNQSIHAFFVIGTTLPETSTSPWSARHSMSC